MVESCERAAKVFKALGNPYRLQALGMLQSGEKCACTLNNAIGLCPSTLSHHMKILVDSGLVNARQQGKWVHYSISEEGARAALALLARITAQEPAPASSPAEHECAGC